jgi:Tol biopolymer transport system component
VVATHNHHLELIDLVSGVAKPFGEGLLMGAWSPDGRWLAALESDGRGRTILMDAHDYARRRIVGSSDLEWSPDSRYLLGWKEHDLCGPDFGTLQMIDIETGRATAIESSKCKVNQSTIGWLSADIAT